MEHENVTASYQGGRDAWRGVLKCNGRVVWVCRHLHSNRDQSTRASGKCALACANEQLDELRHGKQQRRMSHMGGYSYA